MRVGVLGGGLQGCCAALALARRGLDVTLFDRNNDLLTRAAVANEGKIHLGYMYAGDPTLATAKTMIKGALAFGHFLERHLGIPAKSFAVSRPAAYVVHRDGQRDVDAVSSYIRAVHALIMQAAEGRRGAYLGRDVPCELRSWSTSERQAEFDPEIALAVFDTPEIAINPIALADSLRKCVAAQPRIQIRMNRTVLRAHVTDSGIAIESDGPDGRARDSFDQVVNALWDGRFAVDATAGLHVHRPWIHRLKYGVSFRLPNGARTPPSATIVLGPFGEVVSYSGGLIYLTWYPACLQAVSHDMAPPDWPTSPSEPLRSQIVRETLAALAAIVPSLLNLDADNLPELTVKGGAIVAWGDTDIYDPASELHRRYEIGVTSYGAFHSVDPGKLTMAPYFAEACAERIKPLS
jgi:glycine/D-amino acid oxidase-like deaminating enzyme